jgi:hypothetical protein
VVEVIALANLEEDNGWAVLATTVPTEACVDTEILQVYQEQNPTVEPGFRWLKHPAALAPVWREKPERIAAWAMLTVLGFLVYSVIQRQVRLSLRTHDQQLPGNKGLTATPTAAVVLALFAQIALGRLWMDGQEITQLSGVQAYHLLVCDALGLDSSWYAVSSAQKNGRDIQTPWTWVPAVLDDLKPLAGVLDHFQINLVRLLQAPDPVVQSRRLIPSLDPDFPEAGHAGYPLKAGHRYTTTVSGL